MGRRIVLKVPANPKRVLNNHLGEETQLHTSIQLLDMKLMKEKANACNMTQMCQLRCIRGHKKIMVKGSINKIGLQNSHLQWTRRWKRLPRCIRDSVLNGFLLVLSWYVCEGHTSSRRTALTIHFFPMVWTISDKTLKHYTRSSFNLT